MIGDPVLPADRSRPGESGRTHPIIAVTSRGCAGRHAGLAMIADLAATLIARALGVRAIARQPSPTAAADLSAEAGLASPGLTAAGDETSPG